MGSCGRTGQDPTTRSAPRPDFPSWPRNGPQSANASVSASRQVPWSALALQSADPEVWQAAHYHRIPLKWWIMLPVCILGVVISDGLLYGMGRFWGPKLLETRWMKRMIPTERRANHIDPDAAADVRLTAAHP